MITHWKFNMAPENHWVVEENSLPKVHAIRFHVSLFAGVCVSFGHKDRSLRAAPSDSAGCSAMGGDTGSGMATGSLSGIDLGRWGRA